MKQKTSNRILSICNILVFIIFWSLQFWGNEYQFGVKIEHSVFSVYEQNQALIFSFKILFIILIIVNLVAIIQNRKDKKVMIWYSVPTIFYIINTLTLWKIEIFSDDDILSKAWCIIPAIILLINFIIEIIHKRRKKSMLLYVLGIIMCIGMFFINKYNDLIWFVISFIMQFIYNKETTEESKIQKIINIISFIILGVAIIYVGGRYIIMLKDLYATDKKSVEFINQIEVGLENENIEKPLIRVCKNNKWGCINQEGEEIIPCEYDYIGSNGYSSGSSIWKSKYFIAKKDETYYILSISGKVLAMNEEAPIPFFTGMMVEISTTGMQDAISKENAIMGSAQILLNNNYLKEEYAEEIFENYDKNVILPSNVYRNDYFNYIFEYQLENGYELEIEEITEYDEYENQYKYNIKVKRNNEIINTYENNGLIIDRYGDLGAIETYTNGDIPYYNLEEKLQGYYMRSNLQAKTLRGNYEVLDTIDDKIIVRDYNDISNIKEMIINVNGNVLVKAKEINATENGYIVKKENNKMVYMNNNLEEKTPEFDFIGANYLTKGLLICANNKESGKEYSLCNLNGNILTSQNYQIIEEDYDFEESYNKSYLLDSIYEETYNLNN